MRRNGMNFWGLIAIGIGVVIILSIVLPKSFSMKIFVFRMPAPIAKIILLFRKRA